MCGAFDFGCYLAWLSDEIQALFLWMLSAFLNGLAALVELLPVPDFMLDVPSFYLPPGVMFFASAFELDYGIGVVVSAYTARFILRRIPGIG